MRATCLGAPEVDVDVDVGVVRPIAIMIVYFVLSLLTCEADVNLRTCEPAKRQLTTDEADKQAGIHGRTPLASQ